MTSAAADNVPASPLGGNSAEGPAVARNATARGRIARYRQLPRALATAAQLRRTRLENSDEPAYVFVSME